MERESDTEPNIYETFDTAVKQLYGGDPDSKRTAQSLTNGLPAGLQRPEFVDMLFQCLSSIRWQSPTSSARSNWLWRPGGTDHSESRDEVRLERAIVDSGGRETWTFQMSTMSGIFKPGSHQRRAIDLVHCERPEEYAFIELKIKSNNPVFAAFEILGYGLAYCHARRHADVHRVGATVQVVGHDILCARKVRLVVLGPTDWYQFHLRGAADQPFELKELSAVLNSGLKLLQGSLALPGFDALNFEFRHFVSEPELLQQVGRGEVGGTALFEAS